ncbi:MAG: carboxypeptidase-like regulatory domain-containing protein [Bacteroidaceae bacterium]|nr:carboxypeptidase-like regulatory domain-containing protein [Bacteroidaceae bacterium]
MRRLILLLSFLCPLLFCQGSLAQEAGDTARVKLRGSVVDENQEPIPMVVVRIEGQGIATTANLDGKYNIQFRTADSVVVTYQMVGFQKRQRVLKKPVGELVLNIVMKSSDRTLDDVEVVETRRQMSQNQTLNTQELKRLPSTTGNAVEELVATQAGVSSHNELSSQYNVRGGSFDENCVYINGVEVYRPLLISSGQQEGLSVINSDMVERVDFSAGGFEAKYGDKMSSVLDITYRKPKGWEGSLQGSLLGANAYAGYGKRKFSFSNGLRYKTNQYMLGSLETKGEYRPTFLDYQAYLSWSPSPKWTIDAIGYISKNNYKFVPKDRETRFGTMEDVKEFRVYFDGKEEDLFRTLFGTAKITRKLNDRSNLSLAFSAFTTKERETYDIQGQYWLNETNGDEQLGVGTYMEHARNLLTSNTKTLRLDYNLHRRGHTMLAGIAWKHESIRENAREWESRDSSGYSIPHTGNDLMLIYNLKSVNKISSNHMEMYLQDTWRKESSAGILSVNYGARLSYWDWNSEWLFSPRVSMGFVPEKNDNFTLRLATGLYYQRPFYKELRDTVTTNGNTRVELNKDIKSQRSFQVLAAMEYKFRVAQRPFKFTTELYYKAQSRINPYNVDNVKVVYYGQNIAKGFVTGIDFKVYGEMVPGTDSWISFGLMKAQMELNGKKIPQPTDQRWNLNFFFTDYFPNTTRWKMNLKASFADGLPFGAPHTGLERHAFRAPAYKRIDIGMNYRALNNEDRHLRHNAIKNIWLGLDCFNIFGFSNVSGYYWVTDVVGQQFAVPNYLTGRMINGRFLIEF